MNTDENILVCPELTCTISLKLNNVAAVQAPWCNAKLYGYDYKKRHRLHYLSCNLV